MTLAGSREGRQILSAPEGGQPRRKLLGRSFPDGVKARRIATGTYLVMMLALLAFPIGLVVIASFQGGMEASIRSGNWSASAYRAVPPQYWESLWFSVMTAFWATVIALTIAIPAAWGLVRGNLRERHLVGTLMLLPDAVHRSRWESRCSPCLSRSDFPTASPEP